MKRPFYTAIFSALLALILISCNSNSSGDSTTLYDVSVSISPNGAGSISPVADSSYEAGQNISLQAQPNNDYVFVGWTGSVESSQNPISLTVNKSYGLTALFELKSYQLGVDTQGQGTVIEQVLQAKNRDYDTGTVVELLAIPLADSNYRFVEWQGDVTGNANPAQITIDAPKQVTAIFEKKTYPLTVLTEGQGAVTEQVVSAKVTDYEHGAVVELTASPSTGWEFAGWEGDWSTSENPTQVTVDRAKEVRAIFEQVPAFYLADNGVTILCPFAQEGDVGYIFGEPYTKRSAAQITPANASSTCTSGITDMSSLFEGATTFNGDISHWDVSSVYSMRRLFRGASSFNGDISSWDVSRVVDMSRLFMGASSFSGDLSSWDVSYAMDMFRMFQEAGSFNSDLSSWDVSDVTNMGLMFDRASSFNADISSWNVGNVRFMTGMFQGASNFNQDLSSWDVSSATGMYQMFAGASMFNADLSSWNVSNVTHMGGMFSGVVNFNADISSWDVSSVTNMNGMFFDAQSFNGDLSSWDVSNVTDMGRMFTGASNFNGNISTWNVAMVTDMGRMFQGASSFNGDLSTWEVSSVTKMNQMFDEAVNFSGDISSWDVSSVTTMNRMFMGATNFNSDIGGWDVSSVTDMGYLFWNAATFNQDLSGWCVSNIPSEPNGFSDGAPLTEANKPVWGTCPAP